MKGFDVLKVKSAVKNHNKFDLSRTHLTTMDFGQIVPLFSEELVPGDKFTVNGEFFSRMAPLVKPTYGKFSFKTVAGFVPYHQIAVDAEAWLAGKTTWEGQTPLHRFITIGTLADFVIQRCLDSSATVTDSNKEFQYTDPTGTLTKVMFTPQGRYWIKVLNSLGYALPQGVDMRTTSSWYTTVRTVRLSAYPLLAFFKLYNDYMSQSQRYNSSQLSNTLYCIKYGKALTGYTPSTGEITHAAMYYMFIYANLCYENDYFTSAWQSPNNPLNAVESVASTSVVGTVGNTLGASTVSNNIYGTSVNQYSSSTTTVIVQRALDFLKSFDNWVRRNNYSGSRAVQQVYSRFGIKTDDYRTHYANVIKTDIMPIQIGDVTATADSTNVPLGDYAGKGIMNGSKAFSYESSDYGMLFVFGYFTVAPMMSFGYDRKVLRSTPLDYYNPEFDGLGADPISLGEVWASPIASTSDTTLDTQVFGYTERYNAYRYGRDVITGDFRNFHADGDMNAWHSGRNLASIREAGSLVAQSSSMNTLPQTDSEYNRIFSYTGDDVDHFYVTARFNVDAIRPMLNLNQVADLGEGNTIVPRNGNEIS